VKASVFDWKKVIEESDFEVNFTSAQLKAARLALKSAVEHNDPALVEDLSKSGVPFDITVSGESGILPYAMTNRSFVVIEKLLDLNLDLGESPIIYASECSDGLLRRLVGCGVRFDEEAMFSAAEYGAIEGAVELAKSKQLLESQTIDATREKALERAKNKEEDASAVESGKLGSYLTAEEYREQAESLRRFGEALCND
jgi:hypothetical protein